MPESEKDELISDSEGVAKKYPRFGKRGAPQAFATKLLELLSKESSDIVGWTSSGTAFRIKDTDRFTSEVLNKYFKHNNASSFQRQLNLYGFRKVLKGPDTGSYLHPNFQRDKPDAMISVRRTVQASQAAKRTPKSEQVSASNLSDYIASSRPPAAHSVQDTKRRKMTKDDMNLQYQLDGSLGTSARPPIALEGFPPMAYSQMQLGPHHIGYPMMNLTASCNSAPTTGAGVMSGMHLPGIAPLLVPANNHPGLPMSYFYPQPSGSTDDNMNQNSQHMMLPQYQQFYFPGQAMLSQSMHSFNGGESSITNILPRSAEISDEKCLNPDVAAPHLQHAQNQMQAQFQMHLMAYGQHYNNPNASIDYGATGWIGEQNMQAIQQAIQQQQQQVNISGLPFQQTAAHRATDSIDQNANRVGGYMANPVSQSLETSSMNTVHAPFTSTEPKHSNGIQVTDQVEKLSDTQSTQQVMQQLHKLQMQPSRDHPPMKFSEHEMTQIESMKPNIFQLQRMQALHQKEQMLQNIKVDNERRGSINELSSYGLNGRQNFDNSHFASTHDQSTPSTWSASSDHRVTLGKNDHMLVKQRVLNGSNAFPMESSSLSMFLSGQDDSKGEAVVSHNTSALPHSNEFERSRTEV